ncbi:hypothetical protein, partial [Micromonospora sp. NPDC023814]|uniref:hypothetical protein n=1 Tax=Micromonospora sp. NPDC023814 TaxID=3154596 RepID=UPI0033E7677A
SYEGGFTSVRMDGDGSVTKFDGSGRVVSVTSVERHEGGPDTYSTTTYSAWDEKGQPTAGSGPDGAFTLSYEGGFTSVRMDGDGSVTKFDGSGRVVSVTSVERHEGGPDTYSVTTFTGHDEYGRPTAGSDDGGHFTIAYDSKTGYETLTYDSGPNQYTKVVLTGDGKLVSTTLPDGTFVDWQVQLQDLGHLALAMPKHQQAIASAIRGIESQFSAVREAWVSPAADSFDALAKEFGTAAANLSALLAEAANRMTRTYQNIVDAETINAGPH